MKKYIEYLKAEKTPHERRAVAAQVAGVCAAVIALVWVTTLGVRLAAHDAAVANQQALPNTAATLNAVQNTPPANY